MILAHNIILGDQYILTCYYFRGDTEWRYTSSQRDWLWSTTWL